MNLDLFEIFVSSENKFLKMKECNESFRKIQILMV